mmetsp:Transcript_105943/g.341794  ORF Transcript_105943/g.341794 Transcript_105943/m.341794 type:complete len:459 (-) Transcript_105943:18-1394(-)
MRPGPMRGTRFAPNFPALPALFGLSHPTRCGAAAPRVFVRDLGRSKSFVRCSTGLRSTETWFHRLLLHSDCAAADEASADLVFLPLSSLCNHFRLQGWTDMQDHAWRFPFVRPYYELAAEHAELLREVRRTSGRLDNHLLFFAEEKWPMFGMGSSASSDRPRLLVVEARPVHCSHYDRVRVEENIETLTRMRWRCFHCFSCFRPNYDVVVPSFIDYYSRTLLIENDLPYGHRRWLVMWYGSGGPESQDGTYCEVINWRWRLASLIGLKSVAIGGSYEAYEYLLGESRFCLVPKGLGYWTHRLFEVIRAGCIPVILSDHVVLPFQGVAGIDWTHFSVKWPEEQIGIELYRWLLHLDRHRGQQLKAALDKVACWFDYHPDEPEGCSAMHATLLALASPMPVERRLPDFWNSPNFRLRTPEEQLELWQRERELSTNATETPAMELFQERLEGGAAFGGVLV